ncbi:peptide ABC transporter substrate-binding protein [Spongiibacter taiwanensis]|uniref:peptide ABC transporter substrate-binding protein n=1 Tax=Spongiibacter taiwanensis TaxID=1748242 RepID=UPI002035FBDD|nr:peptide ABC transporter substrate-binding protein [Spongiibacter taiwanensis]USA43579.1 peptide ABC transporter substrate-binding protein [Spongiibacter taiwanensis]
MIKSGFVDKWTRAGNWRYFWSPCPCQALAALRTAFAGSLAAVLLVAWVVLSAPAAQAQAVDVEKAKVTVALATEPPTLNSAQATDSIANFVLSHLMQGLLTYGPEGNLVAGVAERWELRADGATFWLRENARWSDGEPVRAADFVFAWRYALTPSTASQYAFIFYPIKNAEAVNNGILPPHQLGVTAVSDRELQVVFETPCPYFLSLTAFMTFMPLREDVVTRWGGRYAADKDKMVYNGPFVLDTWVHGAHVRLRKNAAYWNADEVQLNEIDMPYVTSDFSAQFNLFRDERIALAALDTGLLDEAVRRGYDIHDFHTGSLYFLEFNFRPGRVTNNLSFRRAVQRLIDPALLVNKVIGMPGIAPAYSLFPKTVKGQKGFFRDEYPEPRVKADLLAARHLLEKAKKELGISRWPPLMLLSGDSPRAQQEAEYYQYLFREGLGIELRIDQQVFKQRLEKMRRGDFDIVVAAWGPDYDDIMTFGDLFASWNDNNRGRYSNPHYDRWVRIAQRSDDPETRFKAMAQVQRIVVEDVPILPTYENGILYVQHPRLKGVRRGVFGGDPNFIYAWIEP